MKIYIVGNNRKDNVNLSNKLSKLYDVKNFELAKEEQVNEINKTIKENSNWIIESEYNENSNILAANATTIIYLKLEKKNLFGKTEESKLPSEIIAFLRKYSSKILILKSSKEIDKLIDAIYERFEL